MREEVVIPLPNLVLYHDFRDEEWSGGQFLVIRDRILDLGEFPMDTEIDVVTSIGLDPTSASDVTIEMKTLIWLDAW